MKRDTTQSMRLLLFGKNGQLGWELHRSLQGLGQVWAYDYPEVDFRIPSSLKRLVEDIAPHMVINAAAYTDVDKAESEPEIARLINTKAPGLLAETCLNRGIAFIHFSTDYVFDGFKVEPYQEGDSPNPLNVYGRTKFEGEREILDTGGTNLVFRTAWVYSLRRDSFVTKVLHWARNQREMRIVDDQVSNPTWARALAEITSQLLAKAGPPPFYWLAEIRGLYHIAGWGLTSRYQWARAIIQNDPNVTDHLVRTIIRARSTDFPTPAVRPRFSALDCGRFERTFSLRLPNWEDSLIQALRSG